MQKPSEGASEHTSRRTPPTKKPGVCRRGWSERSMEHGGGTKTSGIPLSHRPGHCIAKKGQQHVTCVVSGDKSQITILAFASATGNSIPPFVIFDLIRN